MNSRKTTHTLCGSLVLFLVLSVASGFASAADDQSNGRYGGKYSVALSSEPESLDPAFITGIYAVTVANNIYDGLVEFDKDLNIVPAIARMWKISRDHCTYSFDLRRGVKFHNGREVTADDFAYSIRRILDPETHSPVAWLFLNIRGAKSFHEGSAETVSGIEVLDRYKLKITLDQPFSPFLSILAMVNARVVPKEAVGPEFSKYPVGTGPFQFDRWRAGQEIILTSYQHYYQ